MPTIYSASRSVAEALVGRSFKAKGLALLCFSKHCCASGKEVVHRSFKDGGLHANLRFIVKCGIRHEPLFHFLRREDERHCTTCIHKGEMNFFGISMHYH